MRIVLSLCLVLLLQNAVVAQKVKVDNPIREIRFVYMEEGTNEPFWRRRIELSTLMYKGIKKGLIPTYTFGESFMDDGDIKAMTIAEWKASTMIPAYDPDDTLYYPIPFHLFSTDLYIFGVDVTYGKADGKTVEVINYLHFYMPAIETPSGESYYIFSVKWEDLIAYLKKYQSDVLYYDNIFHTWWRGDMHITHGEYFIDMDAGYDYINHFRKRIDSTAIQNLYSMDGFQGLKPVEEKYNDYCYAFLVEDHTNWELEKLGLQLYNMAWDIKTRFTYDWDVFQKAITDSIGTSTMEVMPMWQALLEHKLVYSQTMAPTPMEVSKNGRFVNGKKDKLCRKKLILPNFDIKPFSPDRLAVQQIEAISLSDSLNYHLHQKTTGLVPLIIKNVMEGKLPAYKNDSLTSTLSHDQLLEYMTKFIYPEYYEYDHYEEGDIVLYDRKCYRAKFNFEANGAPINEEKWQLLSMPPPMYDPFTLTEIELVYTVSFDTSGHHKSYALEGIGVYIPAEHPDNFKGIQIPVCHVKWGELKALGAVKEATSMWDGEQKSLIEIIEGRFFFAYFLKTSALQLAD